MPVCVVECLFRCVCIVGVCVCVSCVRPCAWLRVCGDVNGCVCCAVGVLFADVCLLVGWSGGLCGWFMFVLCVRANNRFA